MSNHHQSLCQLFLISAVLLVTGTMGFTATPPQTTRTFQVTTVPFSSQMVVLAAKKKKKGKTSGQGFGKESSPPPPPPTSSSSTSSMDETTATRVATTTAPAPGDTGGNFLQSVEGGGSNAIPTMDSTPAVTSSRSTSTSDPSLPPEERAQKVLREQYGMRTMAEQKMEDQIQANRRRLDELKKMADSDQDLDIMAMIPAPILKGIDTFLKLGVAVCTVIFVTAGFGIALEAWSITSGNPLPENIDNFIVAYNKGGNCISIKLMINF